MINKIKVILGFAALIVVTAVVSVGVCKNSMSKIYALPEAYTGTYQVGEASVGARDLLAVMQSEDSDSTFEYILYHNESGDTIASGEFKASDDGYAVLYSDEQIYGLLFYTDLRYFYFDMNESPLQITKISDEPIL